MSTRGFDETVRKSIALLVYLAAYVFSVYLAVQWLISGSLLFTRIPWKLYREAPVFYYGTPVLLTGFVFGVCGLGTLRLERLSRPGLGDHLRRCVFLYVGLLSTIVLFFVASFEGFPGHTLALIGIAGIAPAAFAILLDALILSSRRRRFVRVSRGGRL